MKIISTFIGLIFCLTLCGQSEARISFPMKEGKVFYETIDSSVSLPKEKIYNTCKAWVARSFNSANDVIQYDNKEEGKMIVKGFFKMSEAILWETQTTDVYFTLTITCKDNKYRIQVFDFKPTDRPMNARDLTYGPWDLEEKYSWYLKKKNTNDFWHQRFKKLDLYTTGFMTNLKKEFSDPTKVKDDF